MRLPGVNQESRNFTEFYETARDDTVALGIRLAAIPKGIGLYLAALDAIGQVPWWPEDRREVTLHRILVHMVAETDRHAGHADIVRELIDGAAGLREGHDNLAPGDQAWWDSYRRQLERVAQEAG
jgi:hypothetical protein